jgi:hypothetical protein
LEQFLQLESLLASHFLCSSYFLVLLAYSCHDHPYLTISTKSTTVHDVRIHDLIDIVGQSSPRIPSLLGLEGGLGAWVVYVSDKYYQVTA